jgi:hypothetical protein
MNRIYEGDKATIIAAPAKDSSPGLPGVSRPGNSQQPAEWIGDYTLASSLPHVSIPVAASVWVTRGWTYQEAILSRRCLCFIDQQVYFLCKNMSSCESITVPPTTKISTQKPRNFRTDVFDVNLTTTGQKLTGLWEFFDNLRHYKSRELKQDSDSLNAFQGLLTRSDFKNIWGVPVAYRSTDDHDPDEAALKYGGNLYCKNQCPPVILSKSSSHSKYRRCPLWRKFLFLASYYCR